MAGLDMAAFAGLTTHRERMLTRAAVRRVLEREGVG